MHKTINTLTRWTEFVNRVLDEHVSAQRDAALEAVPKSTKPVPAWRADIEPSDTSCSPFDFLSSGCHSVLVGGSAIVGGSGTAGVTRGSENHFGRPPETDQLGPLGKSWADAVDSEQFEGSTATPSDGVIATATDEGIAQESCCHAVDKAATYCEILGAFDELAAKTGLAVEKCHGCGQPMKFRAYKVSECPEKDDWCFACQERNLVIPYRVEAKVKKKKGKSGDNRKRS